MNILQFETWTISKYGRPHLREAVGECSACRHDDAWDIKTSPAIEKDDDVALGRQHIRDTTRPQIQSKTWLDLWPGYSVLHKKVGLVVYVRLLA